MEDARVARERRRQGVGEWREDRGKERADRDRPPDHPRCGGVRAIGVAGAEHPSDDHLPGDRDRVEDERDEDEQLVRDLVRADLRVAHPREEGRGDEEGRVERGGADEDLAADANHRPHLRPARAARGRVRTEEFDDEGDSHPGLRDRGACGGSRDSPVEAVDEQQLEDEVDDVRHDDDLERAPQVRDAAQIALAGEGDERRREPDGPDPEVRQRVVP